MIDRSAENFEPAHFLGKEAYRRANAASNSVILSEAALAAQSKELPAPQAKLDLSRELPLLAAASRKFLRLRLPAEGFAQDDKQDLDAFALKLTGQVLYSVFFTHYPLISRWL